MADPAEAAMDGFSILTNTDPYLEYQPPFAYSLPIQLVVNGITVTLLAVLLMHLLFTTQYHYPLAPLNYCLQLSSIVVVFISVIVKIWFILAYSSKSGDTWPYDLDYVAVSIPPPSWTLAQDAAWFLLQALNNGLSNITHIQFLTLLYPSRVEARLIIFTLGPMAIASSGLVFTALSGSQEVLDITDSIRNVLNSTLLLIFTIALVIWGFLVNRRRAWRTDGGTAVFGFGSVFLAVITTTFNFVAVAEDGIDWLQHLLFAAVLWQIWLGWWWWVGSGMGIGEVEDLMERSEKKKRKLARRAARQRAMERSNNRANERAPLRHRASSLAGIVDAGQASATAVAGFTSSVTGILRHKAMSRRNTQRSDRRGADEEEGGAGSPIEMDNLRTTAGTPVSATRERVNQESITRDNGTAGTRESGRVEFSTPPGSRTGQLQQSTNSETSSTSATPSLHAPRTLGQLFSFPTTWLQVYLRRLQHAHEDAARKVALEREERRQHVFESRREREARQAEEPAVASAPPPEAALGEEGIGWGLGSFGIKEHRESAKRLQAARDRLQDGRLLSNAQEPGQSVSPLPTPLGESPPAIASTLQQPAAGPSRGAERSGRDSDWEDIESEDTSENSDRARARRQREKNKQAGPSGRGGDGEAEGGAPPGGSGTGGKKTGWSWWGPLKDWRLSDRSTF